MLFNVNQDGLAHDLIYTTPTNYSIEEISPKTDIKSEFGIQHYVELNELLKYLNYGIDLTQNDLDQIYRELILQEYLLSKKGNGIQTQPVPAKIYASLCWMNSCKIGTPHPEEPCYSLIRKRK